MTTFERVRELLVRVLGVPPESVALEMVRSQFERWDSLNHLTLVMELEGEFGLSLTLDEMTALASVRDIIALVDSKVGPATC
jgi:acyl carrier protein